MFYSRQLSAARNNLAGNIAAGFTGSWKPTIYVLRNDMLLPEGCAVQLA